MFFRNYVLHVHINIRTNKAPRQLPGATKKKKKENEKKKFFVAMETSIAFKHINKVQLKEIMHRFVTKSTDLAITHKKERHVFFTRSYKTILTNVYK